MTTHQFWVDAPLFSSKKFTDAVAPLRIYDYVMVDHAEKGSEHTEVKAPTVKFMLLFIAKPKFRDSPIEGPTVKSSGT
jgi:hypothetical protein